MTKVNKSVLFLVAKTGIDESNNVLIGFLPR